MADGLLVPTPGALDFTEGLATRAGGACRIRSLFVRRTDDDSSEVPPLVQFLRGGQGGETRLKVFLTLLWIAGAPPHNIQPRMRALARLLESGPPRIQTVAIDADERNRVRRIANALEWLSDKAHPFLRVEPRAGESHLIQLLHESGSGAPYSRPDPRRRKGSGNNDAHAETQDGLVETQASPETAGRLQDHAEMRTDPLPPTSTTDAEDKDPAEFYFTLPADVWVNGYMSVLTGAGLGMLLVLLDDSTGRRTTGPRFVSPREARRRYVLSADTWSKGVIELERYGLVDVSTSGVRSDDLDFRRTRKSYQINRSALATKLTRERVAELQRRVDEFVQQRAQARAADA